MVPGIGYSQSSQLSILQQAEEELVALSEKARPTVVNLSPYVPPSPSIRRHGQEGGRAANAGSGVIFDGVKGLIVTNSHVVKTSQKIQVTLLSGEDHIGEIVGTDEDTDLAVVRIKTENPLPTAVFGDSSKLKVGQFVFAIGNPYGLHDTLTFGIVSGLNRENINLSRYEDFIQTDASINPGNSGGPLLNLKGEVVGINSAIINYAQSIGFAIPSNIVQRIIAQLVAHGKVQRGWLGVSIDPLPDELAEKLGIERDEGVLVNAVFDGDPAHAAGIRVGDIILKIGGSKVDSPNKLIRLIGSVSPGQSVKVELFREGKRVPVMVKLASQIVSEGRNTDELPAMGIFVENLGGEIGKQYYLKGLKGIVVSKVVIGSSADQRGVNKGDLITSVNGQQVLGKWEFNKIMDKIQIGSPTFLTILRNDEKLHLTLVRDH